MTILRARRITVPHGCGLWRYGDELTEEECRALATSGLTVIRLSWEFLPWTHRIGDGCGDVYFAILQEDRPRPEPTRATLVSAKPKRAAR